MSEQLTIRTEQQARVASEVTERDDSVTLRLDDGEGVMVATRIAPGAYRVDAGGTSSLVYVAGPRGDRWAWWQGRAFRVEVTSGRPGAQRGGRGHVHQSLAAPMPATVLKILVTVGASVKKGDTVILVEAMKMELPIRAPADAVVTAVNCREGELVPPDRVLIELE